MRQFIHFLLINSICCSAFAETSYSNGLKINWVTEGKGPALMFVHGWTHDMSSWPYQIDEFKDDYQVIAVDLPGHGESDAPSEYNFTIDTYFDAINAVRNDSAADEIVLIGHSMGAALITLYARAYPENIAGLVWVEGPPIEGTFDDIPDNLPPPLEFNRQIREGIINSFFVTDTPDSLKASTRTVMLEASDELANAIIRPIMFTPENWLGLYLENKMLGVVAGNSELPDPEIVGQIFPNATFTKISGTGHFLMSEKPADFNQLITSFLEEISYK